MDSELLTTIIKALAKDGDAQALADAIEHLAKALEGTAPQPYPVYPVYPQPIYPSWNPTWVTTCSGTTIDAGSAP